jgi:hypothetical protein
VSLGFVRRAFAPKNHTGPMPRWPRDGRRPSISIEWRGGSGAGALRGLEERRAGGGRSSSFLRPHRARAIVLLSYRRGADRAARDRGGGGAEGLHCGLVVGGWIGSEERGARGEKRVGGGERGGGGESALSLSLSPLSPFDAPHTTQTHNARSLTRTRSKQVHTHTHTHTHTQASKQQATTTANSLVPLSPRKRESSASSAQLKPPPRPPPPQQASSCGRDGSLQG